MDPCGVKPKGRMSEDTKPGDAIARDQDGHVRISRTIPLHWLAGGLLVVTGQAIAMYYGQQRLSESVRDLQIELKAINHVMASSNNKGVEHAFRLAEIERRLANIENERKR
jgi:hypothetical protein